MSRVLVLLVAVDLISKLAAIALLPWRPLVDPDALFQFALQKNETGVGTVANAYIARFPLPDVLAGLIGYLGATFVQAFRKR
ncbi:MAG: hypothetical protein DME01_13015 [Candidatus Rokuibacteriota bacterium]|nr:MAG: hypothetical protein DME01_13015 [Candidatus Rokubacteria bacterium]